MDDGYGGGVLSLLTMKAVVKAVDEKASTMMETKWSRSLGE